MQCFPGIDFLFLRGEKEGTSYQRVLFVESEYNTWLDCQNVFSNIRVSNYPELEKDLQQFKPHEFFYKV